MGLLKWVGRRAKERSTYTGLSMVVVGAGTMIGKPEIGTNIAPAIEILAPILMTVGGVLIGKPKPDPDDFLPLASKRVR